MQKNKDIQGTVHETSIKIRVVVDVAIMDEV
jgi:hypothetical protein